MNPEDSEILRALYEGHRVAEAERKADRAMLVAMNSKIEAMNSKIEAMDSKIEAMDSKIEAMDSKFEAKLEAMDSKFEAKLEAMDSKIEAMDSKIEMVVTIVGELITDMSIVKESLSDLNARDHHFMHKLGEHDTEISVLKLRLKSK